mmetsp:Transcript_8220/g.22741  ORF Transcript_8220/g.22741 Transcript_8220/m.22741 type:complete len:354 (-) Transcript_8220:159-1220(-)
MPVSVLPQLLPAVVDLVFGRLPHRLFPSRSFLSACLELVISLADAWLAAFDAAGGGAWAVGACQLQRQLEILVGQECANSWWADAQEESGSAFGLRCTEVQSGTSHHVKIPTWQQSLHSILVSSMQEGLLDRTVGKVNFVPSDGWIRFGALWVLCAMDDLLGAVTAHVSKPAKGRGKDSRCSTPATRIAASPGAREIRPGRLLALKHFVAAVRCDDGLRACSVLEICLFRLATGVAPHIDSSQLLAIASFERQFSRWTDERESEETRARAVASAMRVACPSTMRASASESAPLASPSVDASVPSRSGFSVGWLPKSFVREFNAEGEEVVLEPETDCETDFQFGCVGAEAHFVW